LRGRARHRAAQRAGPPGPDPAPPQARARHGRRVCDRRRARAASLLRSHDRRGQRSVRPDRPAGRIVRRRLRDRAAGSADHREARCGLLEVPEPTVSAATGWRVWWLGARPRTLGAGLVPVVVGTAAAGEVIWWRFVAAALVAAGLQVGVNLANDYFDGVRGV